jgi:hypothetical protein
MNYYEQLLQNITAMLRSFSGCGWLVIFILWLIVKVYVRDHRNVFHMCTVKENYIIVVPVAVKPRRFKS